MRSLSDNRLAVLEVMAEMLTVHNMAMERDQNQSLSDFRDVAIMILSRLRTEDEMDDVVSILDERLIKVQEHLAAIQGAMQ